MRWVEGEARPSSVPRHDVGRRLEVANRWENLLARIADLTVERDAHLQTIREISSKTVSRCRCLPVSDAKQRTGVKVDSPRRKTATSMNVANQGDAMDEDEDEVRAGPPGDAPSAEPRLLRTGGGRGVTLRLRVVAERDYGALEAEVLRRLELFAPGAEWRVTIDADEVAVTSGAGSSSVSHYEADVEATLTKKSPRAGS